MRYSFMMLLALLAPAAPSIAASERVIYSFTGKNDGNLPGVGLINVGDQLYGTSFVGGVYNKGVFYSLSPTGQLSVVHSFGGPNGDAAFPYAELIAHDGMIYGTTEMGGANGVGTVYAIAPDSNAFSILTSFDNIDGNHPTGGVMFDKGRLFGTTQNGGTAGDGVVFALTLTGSERVIHNFTGADGTWPAASLIKVGDDFYGTTEKGGKFGRGIFFSVMKNRKVKILHSFGGGSDGIMVYAGPGLVYDNGLIYGMTYDGGTAGQGIVYSMTLDGQETILHNFGATAGDGANPYGTLLKVGAQFYGTTAGGGMHGQGTIYRLSPTGDEAVVHSFGVKPDDAKFPSSVLVKLKGAYYGVSAYGGTYGAGAVFEFKP